MIRVTRLDHLAPVVVPRLESERLVLRPWRATDVAGYAPIIGDAEVMRFMGTGWRYRVKRAAAKVVARVSDVEARRAVAALERHWQRNGYGEWAVEEKAGGELIGRVGFVHHPDWPADPAKIEIGWTLARSAWGRGFATEGARMALGHAFGQLGIERVISIAQPDNVRSQRVMQKLGMERQGTARWRRGDHVWYAADREAWLDAQTPMPAPSPRSATAAR
jgi:RimJ/RimL family protein N-acetyltransferase